LSQQISAGNESLNELASTLASQTTAIETLQESLQAVQFTDSDLSAQLSADEEKLN